MALIGINQPSAEPQKDSGLDKVLKGIQIAQGLMGTALAIPKFMQDREEFKSISGQRAAQAEEIRSKLEPISKEQQEWYRKQGVPEASLPRNVGQAQDWSQTIYKTTTETPGQVESREFRKLQTKLMVEAAQRAARAESREVARLGKPKELSQPTIANIQEGNEIPRQLDSLTNIIDENINLFGPVKGRAGAINVYDPATQLLETDIRNRAQAFGRFMEGGVLRKEDEAKYQKMFPNLSDTPQVAKGKLKIVKELQNAKQKALIRAYKEQGFDMRGLEDEVFNSPLSEDEANDF